LHAVADLGPIAGATDRRTHDDTSGARRRGGLEEAPARKQRRPQDGWLANDAHFALLIRMAKPHDGREV
jgi:hypothetical protein